jgi:hypothetical protein
MTNKGSRVLPEYAFPRIQLASTAFERDSVYEYLVRKKKIMPRTAFRYALEKFDEETRSRLMKD